MGDRWRKFRAWDSRGLLIARVDGRFAYSHRGYVVDRRLFQAYLLIVLMVIGFVAYEHREIGWRSMYFHCDASNLVACENPCYGEEDCGVMGSLRYVEFIPPGQGFGVPPDPSFRRDVMILWGVVMFGAAIAFLLNHWNHNRGRSFGLLFPEVEV